MPVAETRPVHNRDLSAHPILPPSVPDIRPAEMLNRNDVKKSTFGKEQKGGIVETHSQYKYPFRLNLFVASPWPAHMSTYSAHIATTGPP